MTNLHLSLDRTHVANYAQWTSTDACEVASQQLKVQAHFKEAASLAEGFEPIVYQLRHTHTA